MLAAEHRIFVSHSHLDNEFVMKLAQDLLHALIEDDAVFYDVIGVYGGETWWDKIIEELIARDIFLLVLSPDAMNSVWVHREKNIALNKNKRILPVLYRECTIWPDVETLEIISFLAPKRYETAFQEILVSLHLPVNTLNEPKKSTSQHNDPASRLVHQMETAFIEHDWPDVIRKAEYLIKHMPASMTSLVYRWQGVALVEEGEEQQAQEAFQTALALVSDRQERLTLLSDYTTLLVRQHQWAQVLRQAKEALRLVPHDPAWQTMQQQAQDQLAPQIPPLPPSQKQEQTKEEERSIWEYLPDWIVELLQKQDELTQQTPRTTPPQRQEQTREEEPSSNLSKTKEQWIKEGNSLSNLKQYEEALSACEQAIRLDPNYALAYATKGTYLANLKRYEEALSAFEQAIHLDPTFTHAYTNKGVALRDLKRYEEALSAFEQAIHLDPNDAFAYYNKGNVLCDLELHEEALSAYEQAIHLDPNDAEAYYNKGHTLESLGKKEEAQQSYNNARKLGYHGLK